MYYYIHDVMTISHADQSINVRRVASFEHNTKGLRKVQNTASFTAS